MKISVVTTMYYSSPYLKEFYRRTMEQIKLLTNDYEIIFVNDGSPDDSLEIAKSLLQEDNNIKILDLSRNFGHHKAIMTGLKETNGDLVFLIDCDLEEEPELLSDFFLTMQTNQCDVVYGIQEKRKGNWFEKLSGNLFYKCRNRLVGSDIPQNTFMARLMKNKYVHSLLKYKEQEISLDNIFYFVGFNQIPFYAKKHSKKGTTYSVAKKVSLAINSITAFSSKPLVSIFYTGLVITLISFLYVVMLVANYIFFSKSIEGWTTVVASIWLLGGITILFIGIIGIYLSKVFTETKKRPYTIIKNKYKK